MTITQTKSYKCFGGKMQSFSHFSINTKTKMTFSIFIPDLKTKDETFPVLYFLSGLTCSSLNFMEKSGALRVASKQRLIIVTSDTSPRGDNIANSDSYDLGQGAGFYVDATQKPWKENYQMYSYITDELYNIVESNFPSNGKSSISGHSMGGHGALIMGLKNQDKYRSISAFSPISHPSITPWGIKAFNAYLGKNIDNWKIYDSTEIIQELKTAQPIKISQGSEDEFYKNELFVDDFINAAKLAKVDVDYSFIQGYDHSYYFISSFIEEHIMFHMKHLNSF